MTFETPGVREFAEAVDGERQRQLTTWGVQRHPDHAGDEATQRHSREMFLAWSINYRSINNGAFDPRDPDPRQDWAGIVLEEVYEALAESDPAKIRAELIQVAAVCAAWVDDIDSRAPAQEDQ